MPLNKTFPLDCVGNHIVVGIDVSEVLQYPDFSCVVLYRKLGIVGSGNPRKFNIKLTNQCLFFAAC